MNTERLNTEPNEQEKQRDLIKEIEEKLYSGSMDERFKGIKLIPGVINPIERAKLESRAFGILRGVFETFKIDGNNSATIIRFNIQAMRCVACLSGNLKDYVLREASKIYNILRYSVRAGNIDYPQLDWPELGDVNLENQDFVSNKTKIEWALFLLRAQTWEEISDGVKLFYNIGEEGKSKMPEILKNTIDKKIVELITLGLKCQNPEKNIQTVRKDGKKYWERIYVSPLERNALFANLMAIDLINYVPEELRAGLIFIAEENTEMGDEAKKKLQKIKESLPK